MIYQELNLRPAGSVEVQVKGEKVYVDAVVDCRQDYWRFLI
jgi:hypothetical protein